ncbi:hypothetical protein GCM10010269_69450 [Streptomyces humidus]|uniref:Pyruvate carboxyltransferase domain-containing protein n=1 Tax=Streptomyces humidus TaxID=52259 RepID=A0A918G6I0_9ACTN|nr:hypothetical protein [Streptomyces humidus]GGS20653.1 hypothetical protein GCM10010269_69450 [Streptomyces humidus]
MPNTPLQFIGIGLRFISWEVAHPEFMQLVYDRLVANGVTRYVVLDPMHDMDAVRESARMIRAAGATEIVGALTFTVSDVHDDAHYASLAAQMTDCPDIDRVYIKDPGGLLTSERAATLIPAVLGNLAGTPLELHSHCTIGLPGLTYLKAADLGVQALQVACGALAGGTSLPNAQQVVANLREIGHTVDVDDRLLGVVADYFDGMAAAEGLPVGGPRDYDAAFMRHQVAGGVMTTLHRQLDELGFSDRFDAVIEEVTRVRAELGHPIMVTPFPQMVCTQPLQRHRRRTLRERLRPGDPVRAGQLRPPHRPRGPAGRRPPPGPPPGEGTRRRTAPAHRRGTAPALPPRHQRRGTAPAGHDAGRAGGRHGGRRSGSAALQPGNPRTETGPARLPTGAAP